MNTHVAAHSMLYLTSTSQMYAGTPSLDTREIINQISLRYRSIS